MTVADKLTQVAENTVALYERGQEDATRAFWDDYQQKGKRTAYTNAFYGSGWTDQNFYPRYPLDGITAAQTMFQDSRITDLAGRLSACGVPFSTAKCANMRMMFYWCRSLTAVPPIDTTAVTDDAGGLYALFGGDEKLVCIEKLILKESGAQQFELTFTNCVALRDIRIEGCIGQDLDMSYCTQLTPDSLRSILAALADRTGATRSYTLTLGAANLAKLSDTERQSALDKGWVLQ